MKKITFSVLVLGILCTVLPAKRLQAQEVPALNQFVSQEISSMSRAVEESSNGNGTSDNPSYYFRQFMVRVQALAGIDIPWLASFQIVPEVELVWYRSFPSAK